MGKKEEKKQTRTGFTVWHLLVNVKMNKSSIKMILSHCLQVPKNKNPGKNKMYIENVCKGLNYTRQPVSLNFSS